MKIGGDFFKILSIVIRILRMFFEVFGDDEDKKSVKESMDRTANSDFDSPC